MCQVPQRGIWQSQFPRGPAFACHLAVRPDEQPKVLLLVVVAVQEPFTIRGPLPTESWSVSLWAVVDLKDAPMIAVCYLKWRAARSS